TKGVPGNRQDDNGCRTDTLERGEEGIIDDARGQHHYGGMRDLSELSRTVGGTAIGISADEKAKKGESTPRKRSLVWAEGTTAGK
ncbi:hypothetical protein H4219_003624, partial [Mycoemilia scoparia]